MVVVGLGTIVIECLVLCTPSMSDTFYFMEMYPHNVPSLEAQKVVGNLPMGVILWPLAVCGEGKRFTVPGVHQAVSRVVVLPF